MKNTKETIHIVTTIDSSYVQHCAVMLSSLFVNNPTHAFVIYLIINFENNTSIEKLKRWVATHQHTLEIIRINDEQIEQFQTSHHITSATYYRLLIPDLVPSTLTKILYLDVDLVIKKEIHSLWHTPLGNNSIAAVKEPLFSRHSKLGIPENCSYFNAGVMLINLEKWRRTSASAQLLRFMKDNDGSLDMLEQDALNAILYNQWLPLSVQWNMSTVFYNIAAEELDIDKKEIEKSLLHPGIIHYTGSSKPWHYLNTHPLKQEYYKYLKLTPWKNFTHPEDTWGHKIKQLTKQTLNILLGRKKFEVYH